MFAARVGRDLVIVIALLGLLNAAMSGLTSREERFRISHAGLDQPSQGLDAANCRAATCRAAFLFPERR